MDKRGGGGGGRENHDFLSKNLCLPVPKNFVGEPFCAVFQKISGSEKVYGWDGGRKNQNFRRKFFVSQYRNISYRNPSMLSFRKFPVAKKFIDKREGEV